jgi:hypothetical protein
MTTGAPRPGGWNGAGLLIYARRLEPDVIAAAATEVTIHFDTPLRDQETLALDA